MPDAALLSPANIAAARSINAKLPGLVGSDIVYAVLPDGEELLVKGRKRLEQVARGSTSASLLLSKINVPEIEAAVALEGILGNDGNLVRRVIGNMLYAQVGSA